MESTQEAILELAPDQGMARRVSIDELWRYARLDRVANVTRPYLESLA